MDAFCSNCPTYGPLAVASCTELKVALQDIDRMLVVLMGAIGGAVQELSAVTVSGVDLEVADIEYWAGFDVAFLDLQDSEQLKPFFMVAIHPAKIELGGPGINTAKFWAKGQWWRHFSLSAGMSLSKVDFGDDSKTAYFIGVGFRLSPYFRVHAGQNFIYGTIDDKNTRKTEWAYGVSINVREIAHVLGLFSGVPETFGQ